MYATILYLIILLFSVSIHETAHGFAAWKMGDPTAKWLGRVTLNPVKHLDLIGSIVFPGLMLLVTQGRGPVFGWAKPVPINPQNFKERKKGEIVTSLAGPLSNLSLAVVFGLTARFTAHIEFIFFPASLASITNLALAFFNALPIPPLDGSHVLIHLWPGDEYEIRQFFQRYGMIILVVFILFGMDFISPLIFKTFSALVGKRFLP